MAEKIKIVFFDLDDTLYDHSHHVESAITELRAHFPFLQKYSVQYLKELGHRLLEEFHSMLLKGEISLEESRHLRWQRFLEEVKYEKSLEDAEKVANFYMQAYYNAERLVPGTFELLKFLQKHFRIGIISNNLLEEQLKKMDRLGISEFVDTYTISEEVGFTKPDQKIFNIALERAEVYAEEAVFIGDSWSNDVLGAQAVGIRPIWLNRQGAKSPDSTVKEIESLENIERILSYIRNEIPTPQITSPDPARV